MKLRQKSALTMFLLGGTLLVLLCIVYFFVSRDAAIKNARVVTNNLAEESAQSLDLILMELRRQAGTIASTPVLINALQQSNADYSLFNESDRNTHIDNENKSWKAATSLEAPVVQMAMNNPAANFLKSLQADFPGQFGEIFMTNRHGALVATTGKLTTFAHAHKYWWEASYSDGAGRFFFDDRGYDNSVAGYVLGVVVPIRQDSKIIGILKCNLNVSDVLSNVIKAHSKDDTFTLKLVRGGGLVVVEEGVEPLSTKIPYHLVERLNEHVSGSYIPTGKNDSYLYAYAPVPGTLNSKSYDFGGSQKSSDHQLGNVGEGWFVVSSQPMDQVLGASDRTTRSLFGIGGLFCLVMALGSALTSRNLTQPLVKLVGQAQRIGQGDFQAKVDIPTKDEVGALASSFNSMAENLQETMISRDLLIEEVSQRELAEEKVARINRVLETSLNEIFIFDAETMYFLEVNRGARENLGYTIDELRLLTPLDIKKNLPEEEFHALIEPLRSGEKEVIKFTVDHFRKDGSSYPVEINLQLVDDRVPLFVAIVLDLTERQKAEEDRLNYEAHLRQQQKLEAIGTLASGVAHEINNPITGIMNYARIIGDELDPENPMHEFCKEIGIETERVATIVRHLLSFARHEKQNHSLAIISDIVDHIVSLVNTIIQLDQITLKVDVPEGLPALRCRSQEIQQVLMNLLTNARDALNERYPEYDPQKIMWVNVQQFEKNNERWIRITVEDSGCGISEEIRDKIFDPFFTTKDRTKGTGLGLAISHGLIKDHHGELKVEAGPNCNTKFHIELPVDLDWEQVGLEEIQKES